MDIYQSITDKIVAQIEADPGQWKMPWSSKDGPIHMPHSADGRYYRGVNVLVLWCAAMDKGYQSPVWATYKQWAKHGCQVRRGEKSEMVVFWKQVDYQNDEGDDESRVVARAFFVFNSSQVDGWTDPAANDHVVEEVQHIKVCQDYFTSVGASLKIGGGRAFYSPNQDFIGIPKPADFKTMHDYYSTLGHEHIHWTGHTSRLDRELNTSRFGNEAYAFEELVAELGSAFLCSRLALENEPRLDHAQYLNSWLRVLKDDKKAIFTAASKAQKAIDYLEAFQPGAEIVLDEEC